jgi:hypothetical protein
VHPEHPGLRGGLPDSVRILDGDLGLPRQT